MCWLAHFVWQNELLVSVRMRVSFSTFDARIRLDFAEAVYAGKNVKSAGLVSNFSIYVAMFYLVSLVSVENFCCYELFL